MADRQALIIHGGCGSYDMSNELEAKNYAEKKAALQRIIDAGWKQLASGTPALDVVESTINLLEDAPCFNAGIGGALDCEKRVSLDASIMRGDTLQAGAVAKLRSIPHAISVARKVMEQTQHVLLVDEGANRFAELQGFHKIKDEEFITEFQLHWWNKSSTPNPNSNTNKGTVGCVARDTSGLIVAGTSTGGMSRNLYGRVGDSAIIGAGTYADNTLGGASATGYGEQILRSGLTRHALDLMHYENLDAMTACTEAIRKMGELKNGLGGIILIDPAGNIGFACNDNALPSAYRTSDMDAAKITMEIDFPYTS